MAKINDRSNQIVNRLFIKIRVTQIILFAIFFSLFIGFYFHIEPAYISYIVLLISCILARYSLWISSEYRIRKIELLLTADCDPPLYIAVYDILKNKRSFRKRKITTDLHLSYAFYLSGDFKKSYDILNQMIIPEKLSTYQLLYYWSLARVARAVDDYNTVESALEQIKNISQRPKTHHNTVKWANHYIMFIQSMLDEKNGDYSKAIETQKDILEKSKSRLEKVMASHRLAKLYLIQSESGKARDLFKYVVENGNLLFCVAEAQKALDEMPGD